MEASEERRGTPGVAPKEAAWDVVREAQASWAGAMRAHELAPPDPGFRGRLRALSEAAATAWQMSWPPTPLSPTPAVLLLTRSRQRANSRRPDAPTCGGDRPLSVLIVPLFRRSMWCAIGTR